MKITTCILLMFILPGILSCAQLFKKKNKQNVAATNGGNAGGELSLSSFKGSFGAFIQQALKKHADAIIDKDVTVSETISINGDITIKGTGATITNSNEKLFVLGNGIHHFSGFNIMQTNDKGVAFYTIPETGMVWTNTITNVNITGGQDGYSSSRGGIYNKANDKVEQWAGTTIENCIIKVKGGCAISIYSQDGPCKYLHLRNVQMSTDVSHNLYIHPTVSMDFDSVASLASGKLAMHNYSGDNEWMYGTARYMKFKRLQSLHPASMWEMVTPKTDTVYLVDCDIAPYTTMGVKAPNVYATNSRFYNGGNGAEFSGTLVNCRGEVWTNKERPLKIEGGNYDVGISFKRGGSAAVNNATINYIWLGEWDNDFNGTFDNCTIDNSYDGGKGKGTITLNKSKMKGRNIRPGALKQN